MTRQQWRGPSVLSGLKEQRGYCSQPQKTVDAVINGFIAIGLKWSFSVRNVCVH